MSMESGQPDPDAKNAMESLPPHEACNADMQPQDGGSVDVQDDSVSAGSNADAPVEASPSSPSRTKRHVLLWMLAALFLLCAGAALYAWQDVRHFLETAPSSPGKSVVVDIRQGMTLQQIAAMLQKEGVVTDALRFSLLARWRDKGRSLQKGRFLVRTDWQPEKVLEMLASGKAMLYRLTLREGMPWWEVADLLEKEGFCKASDFTTVIHDPEFLRHWGIPFGSAEGFLFPETYLLPHPEEMGMDAARAVANRLVDTFWQKADKLWQARPSAAELRDLVILASIVEKETGVPAERARVAGVYANRLRRGMLLQADPTVIYGMGSAFSGQLLRRHLDDAGNRYNTYQNPGLPPGPICSFGASALKAAISPESHDFLYFVATGTDRGHAFSRSLAEHNAAVQRYRQAMRNKKAAAP